LPRFVLLEHDWIGVHWDFMLEIEPGGPLRTWAIAAAIVPDTDLPAQALGDHRAAYLDNEGAVSGGRGTVRRIDRGEYDPLIWTPERVRVVVRGDHLRGVVELRAAVAGISIEEGLAAEGSALSPAWSFLLGNFD
jgi:hypothetical protein